MILLFSLFLIILKAVIDGLQIRKYKTLAGVIEFIYLACITLIAFAWAYGYDPNYPLKDYFWVTITGFILLRYGIFSIILNFVARQKLAFIGNTKPCDIIGRFIIEKLQVSDSLIIFSKLIAAFWGIMWLLGKREGLLP